jgi:hypothetical protein
MRDDVSHMMMMRDDVASHVMKRNHPASRCVTLRHAARLHVITRHHEQPTKGSTRAQAHQCPPQGQARAPGPTPKAPRLRRGSGLPSAFGADNGPAARQCRAVLSGAGRDVAGEFSGRFPPIVRSGRLSAPCSARSLRSLQVLRASPAVRGRSGRCAGPSLCHLSLQPRMPLCGTGLKDRQMTRPTDRREP